MKRVLTIVLAAAAIAATCFSTASTPAIASSPISNKVTIVLATGLTWADVTPTATPTLWRLAGTGAVGNVNSRARFRESGEPPSALEGALDISAGNWATPNFLAGAAYNVTETVGANTAAMVFRNFTGLGVGRSAICFTGLPMTVAVNSDPQDEIVLGTLGQAVHDAGGFTAAVGNSDAGDEFSGIKPERPAGVAAIDERGLVDDGDVSAALLTTAPSAPYGRQTDLGAFARAVDMSVGAHAGPGLLVLDPGDAYRARRNAAQVSPSVAAEQHLAAVRELDRVVALALGRSGSGDSVLVVSQGLGSDATGNLQGFGPILASGPGMDGYLSSASTHRAGIVTDIDVTAAALQMLGITRPVQVIGDPFTTVPAPDSAARRIAHLSALDSTAVAIDSQRAGVVDAYIKLFLAVLGLGAALIVFRDRFSPRTVRVSSAILQALALVLLAVPPACWLMFAGVRTLGSSAQAVFLLLVNAALLWGLSVLVWRRAGIGAAAAALSLFSVALLVSDQLFGAPLSFINFMGYSPLQSARYYGMGNEAAAFVVGAAICGVALVLDRWSDASWSGALRHFGLPVLGAIVVVAAAAPFLGANVGVAIWGSAGFVVAWVLTNGRRITWKTALVAIVIAALLIVAFAAVDVLGHGPKTHLARSLSSAEQGGISQLWLIIARKAQTNARVFGETEWALPLMAVLAYLALMRLRRRPDLAETLADNPSLGSAIVATLVAGVLAFFTEDSGIVVPAFLVLSIGASLVAIMLSRIAAERTAE